MENRMKFKDFRETMDYMTASVLELYSAETGEEFDDNIPDEEFDDMEVVEYSCRGGWLSVTLK